LTMQVMRLSGGPKLRNLWNKIGEMIMAARLELTYSKEEILAVCAGHAPCGGNGVGLEAACWRYLGRQPDELSWGEAAMLAILPNIPSQIHLSRNREILHAKRYRLLSQLLRAGKMDSLEYSLALAEPLPGAPVPIPRLTPHLLTRAIKENRDGEKLFTTIDIAMQARATSIAMDHHKRLMGNHISNTAILVLDVKSGDVLAYVGNVSAGK